jgi:hypothetical protein
MFNIEHHIVHNNGIRYRVRYYNRLRHSPCLWCFTCFRFTSMASCSDIPGGIGPSKGIGRFSNALFRSSGVMLIISGIPVKNCAIGPVALVGICPAGISWSMKSRRSSKSISRSSLRPLDGGSGTVGTLVPVLGTEGHISAPILYAISNTILRTLQKETLCQPSISKKNLQYIGTIFNFDALCHHDVDFFLQYLVRSPIKVGVQSLQYRDIPKSKGKTFNTKIEGFLLIVHAWFDIVFDMPYLVRLGALPGDWPPSANREILS